MIKTRKGVAELKNMITREGMTKTKKRVAKFKELYHQEENELPKEGDELFYDEC